MAHGYLLMEQYSIPGDKTSPKLFYARSISAGEANLDYLCKLISGRSSMSSADVKAVLDSLNYFLALEMQEGRIVRFGELGTFRLSVSSEGVKTIKEFHVSMIRPPRIIFTPGLMLKDTKKMMDYVRMQRQVVTAEAPCDKEHVFPNEPS